MFDNLGKAFLWLFALVGGIVVVTKYGPDVVGALKSKQLPAGSSPPLLPSGSSGSGSMPPRSPNAAILVSCGPGGSSGVDPLQRGVQSSPFYRWCYLVRAGDDSGMIAERITGDSSRYTDLLVANPGIPKKGTMGVVIGDAAWDFAPGSLVEGTKIAVPQTMNAWIDPFGQARGTYLPWPPDPRSIVEATAESIPHTDYSSSSLPGTFPTSTPVSNSKTSGLPSNDGFDFVEESA